jgi:hypothetical protein
MGVGTSAYNLTGFTTLEQFSAVKLLYRPIQYAILTRTTSSEGAEKRARKSCPARNTPVVEILVLARPHCVERRSRFDLPPEHGVESQHSVIRLPRGESTNSERAV